MDGVDSSRDDQNTDEFQTSMLTRTPGIRLPTIASDCLVTRMLLHGKDAMNCGFKSVTIRTVGTDVAVPAIVAQCLVNPGRVYQTLSNSG